MSTFDLRSLRVAVHVGYFRPDQTKKGKGNCPHTEANNTTWYMKIKYFKEDSVRVPSSDIVLNSVVFH